MLLDSNAPQNIYDCDEFWLCDMSNKKKLNSRFHFENNFEIVSLNSQKHKQGSVLDELHQCEDNRQGQL